MRPELVFEEDADRYLQQLEGDLNQVALVRAIHSRLNFLEDHPGSHSNRPLGIGVASGASTWRTT